MVLARCVGCGRSVSEEVARQSPAGPLCPPCANALDAALNKSAAEARMEAVARVADRINATLSWLWERKHIVGIALGSAIILVAICVVGYKAHRAAQEMDLAGKAGEFVWVVIILIFGAALFATYFLPVIIASRRRHPNVNPILVINVFLGWTYLFWVLALAWSLTAIDRKGHSGATTLKRDSEDTTLE